MYCKGQKDSSSTSCESYYPNSSRDGSRIKSQKCTKNKAADTWAHAKSWKKSKPNEPIQTEEDRVVITPTSCNNYPLKITATRFGHCTQLVFGINSYCHWQEETSNKKKIHINFINRFMIFWYPTMQFYLISGTL